MLMIITIHILIALFGLSINTLTLLKPSVQKVILVKIAFGLTLVSGFALVALEPSSLARVCVVGLAYSAFTIFSVLYSNKKLSLDFVRVSSKAQR